MKKIVLYCHDNLWFWHISRTLNIYHALKNSFEVYIIIWGKVPEEHFQWVSYIALPHIEEINIFNSHRVSESLMDMRKNKMQRFIDEFQPDVLGIDYFPFGRIWLQPEIDFLMRQVKKKPWSKVYSYMRDIFSGEICVRKEDIQWVREKIEDYFGEDFSYILRYSFFKLYQYIKTSNISKTTLSQLLLEQYLNENTLDGILVFWDKKYYVLEDEFSLCQNHRDKFFYLWYLLPQRYPKILDIPSISEKKYILLSFWGSIFHRKNFIRIMKILSFQKEYTIKCMIPFFQSENYKKIFEYFSHDSNIEFHKFSWDFFLYLQNADFFVSGWGYWSTMDILYYQIPSLIVLNYNQNIEINKTEDGKRVEIFNSFFPVYKYTEDMTSIDILKILQHSKNQKRNWDSQILNSSWDVNLRDFLSM